MKRSINILGFPEVSIQSAFTQWRAFGVGMVRSDNSFAGMSDTIVLVSYSIP